MFRRQAVAIARGALRVGVVPRRIGSIAASTRLFNTLGDLVAARAAANPRSEVLKVPHQDLTWDATELQQQTDAVAAGLLEMGYTRGSKLALWMGNEAEYLAVVLAAGKIGCTLVAIDPHVTLDGVKAILKGEGCRGLMFSQRFKSEHRGQAMKELTDLENWRWGDYVNDKSMRSLRHLINTGHEDIRGVLQFKFFPVYDPMPDPLPAIRATLSENDVLVIPYQAGADGAGVRGEALTQGDLINTAKNSAKTMKLNGDDVVVVSSWLSGRFGLAAGSLAALHAGAKVIIPAREESASAALNCVGEYNATALVGSATSLADAPALPTFNLASLRTGLLAGVASPPELTGVQAVDETAL